MFENKKQIDFAEFSCFNTENSSEMLLAVIGVLHNRIPCSEFYYREKQKFLREAYKSALSKS